MDPKQILDVPDTPDRVRMPSGDGQDGCSPVSCCSEESCLVGIDNLNILAGRNVSSTENECEGRFVHRGRGIDISGNGRGSMVSINRHSSTSENAPLFRKVGNKSFKLDGRYHLDSKHSDNRKAVNLKCSSKPVNRLEHSMGRCMMGGNTHRIQKSSLQSLQKEGKASKSEEDPLASNSLYPSEDPSKANSSPNKGKAKINDDACKAVPSDSDLQKGLCSSKDGGSEQRVSSHVSFPGHGVTSARVAGQKRLVRNGCISPHNIARAKQAAESSSNCTRDFKWASTNKMAKVDPSNVINVDGDVTGGSTSNQVKGKEIVTHRFPSGEHDAVTGDLSKRINGDVCFREQEHRSGTLHSCNKFNLSSNLSHGSSSSSLTSGIDPSMNKKCRANTFKRHKKDDMPLSSQGRDEIIFIDSGSKPSSSGSQAERSRLRPFPLDDVIEIVDSPKMGCSNSQSDAHLEARARQVEADEMLARELQEQLYDEMPANGSTERDSHLAWMLQQEENVQHAPRSRNYSVTLRANSSSQTRRQSRSQLLRNRYQRGTQARGPTSRVTSLRNSMERTSRLFPSEMDLDTRIELLEALEAVVNDDISRVTQLLDSDREFNENDYDLLLALDENNHEHLGASSAQISNLPESIVQTSNCESCPICLEEPAVGDTIRHLPCLHKFHKDCIDSWLRRKRSCPVCKSDIT